MVDVERFRIHRMLADAADSMVAFKDDPSLDGLVKGIPLAGSTGLPPVALLPPGPLRICLLPLPVQFALTITGIRLASARFH